MRAQGKSTTPEERARSDVNDSHNHFGNTLLLWWFNLIMNTNFTLFQRKARTLSLGRRSKYRELGLSTSVENMAQLHPPHVQEAEVVNVHTRIMDSKR